MVNNTPEDRIKFALEHCGKTQEAVASECNASKQSLQGWKSRGRIPSESLGAFSRATGFNLTWLLEGEGPERRDTKDHLIPILTPEEISTFCATGDLTGNDRRFLEPPSKYAGKRLYALEIEDNTMESELNQGETIVVHIDGTIKSSQNGVFLIEKTGEVVVRKYIDTGTSTLLVPLNHQYPNIIASADNPVKHLGTLLYKIKIYQ